MQRLSSSVPELMASASASSAPELMASASASSAPELMTSHSKNFLLREQKPGSKLGSEANEKVIFRNLPIDVKNVIDQKVIDNKTVGFCNRLSFIKPNNRMDPGVFLEQCSYFIKEVQVFIERMGLGDINPKQQFVFGDTCLEYVERMCLYLLDEMSYYKCKPPELDKLKIQLDVLRNMIIYFFAENRNTANKEMLKEVLVDLDDSEFKKFLSSTKRLILICINTLKSNTDPLVVKDFETRALTLLEECSDILVSILKNERISGQLKKQTMELFTYIMVQMSLIQQAQQTGVQHYTRQKYDELRIKYYTIKEYLEAQRRGGYSQIQSKNKSKRKNNRKNKNKKNKKKTLRLRIKK